MILIWDLQPLEEDAIQDTMDTPTLGPAYLCLAILLHYGKIVFLLYFIALSLSKH